MKLQLPNTTLVCIDGIDAGRAVKVLEHCKSMCDFGDVKLLTHIPIQCSYKVKIMPLNSLIAYSIFMLTRFHEYIDTEKILIVQRDGWILNPSSWQEEWSTYDFIGPLFVQMDLVGSGGFSFRSKHIMEEISKTMPHWDGTQKGAIEIQNKLQFYEDGELCLSDFSKGFNIAPIEQATLFSQGGNRNPKYFQEYPFGFHRTFQQIDFKTGRVDSSDLSRDLTQTYDDVIDELL